MSILSEGGSMTQSHCVDMTSPGSVRPVSQLSLDSIYSSGYESTHSESRTATPTTDLPNFEESVRSSLASDTQYGGVHLQGHAHWPWPGAYYDSSQLLRQSSHNLHDTASSCTDRDSLGSSSSTFSLQSSVSCFKYDDRPPFSYATDIPTLGEKLCHDEDSTCDSLGSTVIHKLKRRSDGWTGPLVRTDDPITSRLKRGRAEAIKQKEVIEEFLSEASSQLEIQREAVKAQSTFDNSSVYEHLEAERIILLAGERYGAYMSEAHQMVSEFGESLTTASQPSQENLGYDIPCPATLYLSGIKLILCDDFVKKYTSFSNTPHHFLCLIKELRTKGITATQICSLSPKHTAFTVEFNNNFTLPWIPHDFELMIEVYHIITVVESGAQPLKRKFMNVISNLAQRTPAVVTRRNSKRLLGSCVRPAVSDCDDNQVRHQDDEVLGSKFQRLGSVCVDRGCLRQRVFNVREQSNIVCAVQAHLQADVDVGSIADDLPLQGYLSVFGGYQWERRWFVLTSHSLSYWLYPDQPEHLEPPISRWDLKECATLPELADPNDCAWENSFVLPLRTDKADKLILSAESEGQLNQWLTALGTLITSSNTWKY